MGVPEWFLWLKCEFETEPLAAKMAAFPGKRPIIVVLSKKWQSQTCLARMSVVCSRKAQRKWPLFFCCTCFPRRRALGDLKITSTSTERQKHSQHLAPVLVIISGNSLVVSRKMITSTGFYWCCTPGASAPVVVKNSLPEPL